MFSKIRVQIYSQFMGLQNKPVWRCVCDEVNVGWKEGNLKSAVCLLLFCAVVWSVWWLLGWSFNGVGDDYRVEFMGLIFDIIFILIVFSAFQRNASLREVIKRHRETLEDYKKWDSEEARFRIAGALRRLNALKVTDFDFSGLVLSGFNFADHKIASISKSKFYDGSWGDPLKPHGVKLNKVSFNWINCEDVQFSPGNPLQALFQNSNQYAQFHDCSFMGAKLRGSSFKGAELFWSNEPVDDLYDHEEDTVTGEPFSTQIYFGPFDGADLTDVSFQDAIFQNADFRGALNISKANFAGVSGLETCVFDYEALENEVLKNSNVKI